MEEDGSKLPYRPVTPYRPNKDAGFVPSQGYEKYRSPGFHMEHEIRRAMVRLRTTDRARAEEYLGIYSEKHPTETVPMEQEAPVIQAAPTSAPSVSSSNEPHIYGVPISSIGPATDIVAPPLDPEKPFKNWAYRFGVGAARAGITHKQWGNGLHGNTGVVNLIKLYGDIGDTTEYGYNKTLSNAQAGFSLTRVDMEKEEKNKKREEKKKGKKKGNVE